MDRGGGGGGKIGVPSLPCEEGGKEGGGRRHMGVSEGHHCMSVGSQYRFPPPRLSPSSLPLSLAAWICITCF